MTKFSDGRTSLKLIASRGFICDPISTSQMQQKSFDDVIGDMRLKRILKRAVSQDKAPQYLINMIRSGIRG